jgi:hypothetical protein
LEVVFICAIREFRRNDDPTYPLVLIRSSHDDCGHGRIVTREIRLIVIRAYVFTRSESDDLSIIEIEGQLPESVLVRRTVNVNIDRDDLADDLADLLTTLIS